jgi:hypothetical protein
MLKETKTWKSQRIGVSFAYIHSFSHKWLNGCATSYITICFKNESPSAWQEGHSWGEWYNNPGQPNPSGSKEMF